MSDLRGDSQSQSSWAFKRLIRRAYKIDPVRTEHELTDMGHQSVIAEMRVDYAAGRLND